MQPTENQLEDQIFSEENEQPVNLFSLRNVAVATAVVLTCAGAGLYCYRDQIFGTGGKSPAAGGSTGADTGIASASNTSASNVSSSVSSSDSGATTPSGQPPKPTLTIDLANISSSSSSGGDITVNEGDKSNSNANNSASGTPPASPTNGANHQGTTSTQNTASSTGTGTNSNVETPSPRPSILFTPESLQDAINKRKNKGNNSPIASSRDKEAPTDQPNPLTTKSVRPDNQPENTQQANGGEDQQNGSADGTEAAGKKSLTESTNEQKQNDVSKKTKVSKPPKQNTNKPAIGPEILKKRENQIANPIGKEINNASNSGNMSDSDKPGAKFGVKLRKVSRSEQGKRNDNTVAPSGNVPIAAAAATEVEVKAEAEAEKVADSTAKPANQIPTATEEEIPKETQNSGQAGTDADGGLNKQPENEVVVEAESKDKEDQKEQPLNSGESLQDQNRVGQEGQEQQVNETQQPADQIVDANQNVTPPPTSVTEGNAEQVKDLDQQQVKTKKNPVIKKKTLPPVKTDTREFKIKVTFPNAKTESFKKAFDNFIVVQGSENKIFELNFVGLENYAKGYVKLLKANLGTGVNFEFPSGLKLNKTEKGFELPYKFGPGTRYSHFANEEELFANIRKDNKTKVDGQDYDVDFAKLFVEDKSATV